MQMIALQSYNIYIGDFWNELDRFLSARQYSKIAILVDDNTKEHCLPILKSKLNYVDFHIIQIQAGEVHKNIKTCQEIWTQMMNIGMDRKSLLINLGGGVIGDMGGFCASTFKRGMDFVQMPTTLLSQVDASIGGKLGVDFMQVKNSIGLFNNPQAVFVSPIFFKTLSAQEIRSGFAEIIKHTIIQDEAQWNRLQVLNDLTKVDWLHYLKPSLNIKKNIVEQDPFEKGLRKALNYGHTIGHAIEGWALETEKPLLHGEAIAIGMICEAWLSHKMVGLPVSQLTDITKYFSKYYDHYWLPENIFPTFLNLMSNDKKNENNQINFSLIPTIGTCTVNQTAAPDLIVESMRYYNSLK